MSDTLDLDTLVAPLGADAFLRDHWPAVPFVADAATGCDRLAALAAVPELADIVPTIERSSRVSFFAPGGRVVRAPHRRKLYGLGLTAYFNLQHVDALAAVAERLSADLGLAAGSITCEGFASCADSGVAIHSDRDVNFALLLQGRKRWRIAPNAHIRNQTGLCVPPSREYRDDRQNELADQQPFPDAMPEDALVVDVEPGGLLFLPRGWWHETEATGTCLQVNFVMNHDLLADVVTKGLRDLLIDDVTAREMAFDLFGPPERRAATLANVAQVVAQLQAAVVGADPAALAEDLVRRSGLRPASEGG